MKTACCLLLALAVLMSACGCGTQPRENSLFSRPAATTSKESRPRDMEPAVQGTIRLPIAARYQSLRPVEEGAVPRPPLTRERRVEPLPIEGLWIPSGWMGDASSSSLEYRICTEAPHSPRTCDEWVYDPSRGTLGWAAVAYQFPENNWGRQRGKDLSKHGFTRLTFYAKGKAGGERVLFKSGGHTSPGAAFPATYESTSGALTLTRSWQKCSMPLQGLDLSNTTAAFTFVINRQMAAQGSTFFLDNITFCGPEE